MQRSPIPFATFPKVSSLRLYATSLALLSSGLAIPAFAANHTVNAEAVAGAETSFQKEIMPFVTKHCYSCHGNGEAMGDFSLEEFKDAKALHKGPEHWDRIIEMLHDRAMPPEDEPQPTQAEVDKVLSTIRDVRVVMEANTPPSVGRVTARRLNKTEYNNTIRDLLGVDFKPAEEFPADDVGYGFDNIGDVLSVSPLLLEKYLAATESILDQAIMVVKPPQPAKSTLGSLRLPAAIAEGEIGGLGSFEEGDYVIRTRLASTQATRSAVRASLRVDGKAVKEFSLKPSVTDPTLFEATVRMKAGLQRVTVAFVNPAKAQANAQANVEANKLQVQSLEVEGPFNPAPPKYSAVHTRLMAHKAGLAPRDAAKEIVTRFMTKAYRRPVQAAEVEKSLAFFDASQKQGEQFELGVRAALYRVLMSPDFLFRIEKDPEGLAADTAYEISEYELASRLSYFMWNTMPDDELFALASKGQLRRNLTKQIQRMVKDPRSESFLRNFSEQWLTLRKLDLISPDPEMFPTFDHHLKESMIQESVMFFDAIAREDRSVLDLLNADFTFVNEPLAKLYGVNTVKGDEFVRVKAPQNRGGVLTMASLLALNSNATRTSPVKRGKFILEEILNTPPPPPPPDVPALEEGKQLTGTLRQIMEQHRENPTCASCHSKMDPLGFAFENFDAIGAWRDKDSSGAPIDASGVLPDGKAFEGATGLKAVLDSKKDLFLRSISDKMLTYALGRGLEYYDRPAIEKIVEGLSKNNYRFSTLVLEIVQSDPFQMRTVASEESQ